MKKLKVCCGSGFLAECLSLVYLNLLRKFNSFLEVTGVHTEIVDGYTV
jgi:hypothetical protein